MVKTLYLIRHGATSEQDERRYKGSMDEPLCARGRQQVKITGDYLKKMIGSKAGAPDGGCASNAGPAAIYTSPLSRARQSAEIIAEPFGLTPLIVPDLRERCFGRWEGMTFLEIGDHYPEEFAAWIANPLDFTPPGGEGTREVARRVEGAIKSILSHHQEGEVVILAHGGVNRVILCLLLGMPLTHIFRIEQDNAALNIIDFYDGLPVVKAMNLVPWRHYG